MTEPDNMRSIHTPESVIADLNAAWDAVGAARDDAALTAAFTALRRARTWLRAHNDAEVRAAYDRLMRKASYEGAGPLGVVPRASVEPEAEPEGLSPGFADALRRVYPELRGKHDD